jgi:hypothetical protein
MVTANPRIVTEAQTWRTFLTMSDDLTVNSLTLPEDAAVAPRHARNTDIYVRSHRDCMQLEEHKRKLRSTSLLHRF